MARAWQPLVRILVTGARLQHARWLVALGCCALALLMSDIRWLHRMPQRGDMLNCDDMEEWCKFAKQAGLRCQIQQCALVDEPEQPFNTVKRRPPRWALSAIRGFGWQWRSSRATHNSRMHGIRNDARVHAKTDM